MTTTSNKTNTRNYYAISWSHGRIWSDNGNRLGTYHSFGSRAERDAWVKGGAVYATERGHREAVPASDAEIRRIKRESSR